MARLDVIYPARLPITNSVNTAAQTTLQAIGDYVAVIRQAEEAATITGVSIHVDTHSGGTGNIVRVGIQSVGANGHPSGTYLGSVDKDRTNANFPLFGPTTHTLGTSVSLTRGQLYAIVAEALSGTWSGAANFRTNDNYFVSSENDLSFPYLANKVAGSLSKSNGTGAYTHSCVSSTTMYGTPHNPANVTSISSASSPNEIGNYFRLPTGIGTSYAVLGVRLYIGMTNSAGTFDITLYDSASTVLQQVSFTCDQVVGNTTGGAQRDFYFDEASLTALTPGTFYRIGIKATNATAIGGMASIYVPTSLGMTAYTSPNGSFIYTSRTGSGAWTDVTGQMHLMRLLISDVTGGSAGPSGGGPVVGGRLIN